MASVAVRRPRPPAGFRRRFPALLALFVAALTLLGACSADPKLPSCGVGASASARSQGYELGAGDRLEVTVFRHEDLSGEFRLNATGAVAMPLVGQIAADDLTARELESAIEEQLREEDYFVDPRVSIEVLTHRPVYVLGQVAEPGPYEYVSGMTLVNAVALAWGYTYRADRDDVRIARGDCMREATAATEVLPGDIIRVPERLF